MRAIQYVHGSSVKTEGKLMDFDQMSVAVDFDLHVPGHGHRTAEILFLGLWIVVLDSYPGLQGLVEVEIVGRQGFFNAVCVD